MNTSQIRSPQDWHLRSYGGTWVLRFISSGIRWQMTQKTDKERRAQQAIVLFYVITFIWVVSFFADIIVKTYEPHWSVHAAFMLVAGSLFNESRKLDNHSKPSNPSLPSATSEVDTK